MKVKLKVKRSEPGDGRRRRTASYEIERRRAA